MRTTFQISLCSSLILISLTQQHILIKALNFHSYQRHNHQIQNYHEYHSQTNNDPNDKTRQLETNSDSTDYIEHNNHYINPKTQSYNTPSPSPDDTHDSMDNDERHQNKPNTKNQTVPKKKVVVTPSPTQLDYDTIDSESPSTSEPTYVATPTMPPVDRHSSPARQSDQTTMPTVAPIVAPSLFPSVAPSDRLSDRPTTARSDGPSGAPSDAPSGTPSMKPSSKPSTKTTTVQPLTNINQVQTTSIEQPASSNITIYGLTFGLLGGVFVVGAALYARRSGILRSAGGKPVPLGGGGNGVEYGDVESGDTFHSESSLLGSDRVLSSSESVVEVGL